MRSGGRQRAIVVLNPLQRVKPACRRQGSLRFAPSPLIMIRSGNLDPNLRAAKFAGAYRGDTERTLYEDDRIAFVLGGSNELFQGIYKLSQFC